MRRADMLDALAGRMLDLRAEHPLRVAVDGIDAAGKTMLADELALTVHAKGRPVIRASIDGFHQPRAARYQRGATSPEGYYFDSFDCAALREALLLPLGPGGSRIYRRAIFDYRADQPLDTPQERAPADAVLVMDGVFLLRPELVALWDFRIFLDGSFVVAMERAQRRDVVLFGSAEAVRARYTERYHPGQRLYFDRAHPHEQADAIVQNDNPDCPMLRLR